VRLCLPVSAVGKNRICKIMFVVRHGNKIHGMKNKSRWNNTRKMLTGFMCISKINLQKCHTMQNCNNMWLI